MRIGVDVMGGDHAPDAILQGALASVQRLTDAGDTRSRIVLLGDERVIREGIAQSDVDAERITVVGTDEIVGMHESPVEAVRSKPKSSIATLARMAGRKADEPLDAIISAGNTGACITAAQMHMRRLRTCTGPASRSRCRRSAGP